MQGNGVLGERIKNLRNIGNYERKRASWRETVGKNRNVGETREL